MASFILYARRALDSEEPCESQLATLRAWAVGAGHAIAAEYGDDSADKVRARDPRPWLDRALFDTVRGAADGIAVTSLDRIARGMGHLEDMLTEFDTVGARLYVLDLARELGAAHGGDFRGTLSALLAFDRMARTEALRRGHARARAKGVRIGAPTISATLEAKVRDLLAAGVTPNRIRTITHCGPGTIKRVRAKLAAQGGAS